VARYCDSRCLSASLPSLPHTSNLNPSLLSQAEVDDIMCFGPYLKAFDKSDARDEDKFGETLLYARADVVFAQHPELYPNLKVMKHRRVYFNAKDHTAVGAHMLDHAPEELVGPRTRKTSRTGK
jgi:hypothetical protein